MNRLLVFLVTAAAFLPLRDDAIDLGMHSTLSGTAVVAVRFADGIVVAVDSRGTRTDFGTNLIAAPPVQDDVCKFVSQHGAVFVSAGLVKYRSPDHRQDFDAFDTARAIMHAGSNVQAIGQEMIDAVRDPLRVAIERTYGANGQHLNPSRQTLFEFIFAAREGRKSAAYIGRLVVIETSSLVNGQPTYSFAVDVDRATIWPGAASAREVLGHRTPIEQAFPAQPGVFRTGALAIAHAKELIRIAGTDPKGPVGGPTDIAVIGPKGLRLDVKPVCKDQ